MQSVQVIDELLHDSTTLNQLKTWIRRVINNRTPTDSVNILETHYPCSTTLFLALIGAYRYRSNPQIDSNNLWHYVWDEFGRELNGSHLGQIVEKVITSNNLHQFPKTESARRYVDLILFQGGIPKAFLDNYFEEILIQALLHFDQTTISGANIIRWIQESGRDAYLQSPVQRYLRHAGDVACDFVERTIDLHQRQEEDLHIDNIIYLSQEYSLHKRVVRSYIHWVKNKDRLVEEGNQAQTLSRRRPEIVFDKIQGIPALLLPQQTHNKTGKGTWILLGDKNILETLEVPFWRTGKSWATRSDSITISSPAQRYEVRFETDEETTSWYFDGFTKKFPLMAFRDKNNAHIKPSQGIPKEYVWIIHKNNELRGNIAETIRCHGEWGAYTSSCLNASELNRDVISIGENASVELKTQKDTIPYLHGKVVDGVTMEGVPVYVSHPQLVIPRVRQSETLEQWKLIAHFGHQRQVLPLTQGERTDEGWVVPLASLELPERTPLSLYVRGPLGRSARISLVLWPELRVTGLNDLILPNEDGTPRTASATLYVGDGQYDVTCEDATVSTLADGGIHLDVRPGVSNTSVSIESNTLAEPRHLWLTLPRLRWQLYDAQTQYYSLHQMKGEPFLLQQVWLNDANLPLIALFAPNTDPESTQFYVDTGNSIEHYSPIFKREHTIFDLTEAKHILSQHKIVRIYAKIKKDAVCLGVYHANVGLQGLHFNAKINSQNSITEITGKWSNGNLFDGAELLLWSLWQPWQDAIKVHVSSFDNNSKFLYASLNEILIGDFLVEIRIEDPWVTDEPRRPTRESSDVAKLTVGNELERAQYLNSLNTSLGYLTKLHAHHNNPAERYLSLVNAIRTVCPEEAPTLLRHCTAQDQTALIDTLINLLSKDGFTTLGNVVNENPKDFIRAIYFHFINKELVAILLTLGFLDSPLSSLSVNFGLSTWPLLGALALYPTDTDLDTAALLRVYNALNVLDDETKLTINPTENLIIRGQYHHFSIDQITSFKNDLGDTNGIFNWLISYFDSPNKSEDLVSGNKIQEIEHFVSTTLRHLPNNLINVHEFIRRRKNIRSIEGDEPAWNNVPYVVGLLAFLLRARAVIGDPTLFHFRRRLHELSLLAIECAPDLFVHDITMIQIALLESSYGHATTA